MDKRKVIILAIVLFLFIGLGTFVFAQNGSDENEGGQGIIQLMTPRSIMVKIMAKTLQADDVDGETQRKEEIQEQQ